jgi:luciferase family oxidoreductase group 1
MMKLGVLDQSPIPEGSTAGQALRNTVELARLAEELGYGRYWVAEHHGTPALACASPEVLIGPIAAATSRIRVGSGGIMLPHYSPLKVAESFSMLSGMFPGRIDLGIGRAAGTSPNIAFALQRDRRQRAPDDFREQLDELLGYFGEVRWSGPPFASPQPYLLGSSPQSAVWAAELGLPYVFADFINAHGSEIVEYYRERFRPSAHLTRPYVIVAAWAICAETDEEALRLSASMRMMMTLLHRGRLIPVPTVEKAQQFLAQEGLGADTMLPGRRLIIGAPARVHAALENLSREYNGADEILIVNIMHDHAARMRSYELIAGELELAPAGIAHTVSLTIG